MEKIVKSKVLKSKSSNNAISNNKDKTSDKKINKSSAKIEQNSTLKKRGPYVVKESKDLQTSAKLNVPFIRKQRPPKRKFLSKVLQILNQSSQGTQYPTKSIENVSKEKQKLSKRKAKIVIQSDAVNRRSQDEVCINKGIKNEIHISRHLLLSDDNRKSNRSNQDLVVLRSKKDIIQTPSENSYNNWNDVGLLNMHRKISEIEAYNLRRNSTNIDLLSPTENIIKNSLRADDKYETKDNTNNAQSSNTLTQVQRDMKKEEASMYKLFVDVLETNFNLYNVKADCSPQGVSKALLEDEDVVHKLGINDEDIPPYEDIEDSQTHSRSCNSHSCHSENIFYIQDDIRNIIETDVIKSNPSPKFSRHNILPYTAKIKRDAMVCNTCLFMRKQKIVPRKARRMSSDMRRKDKEKLKKKRLLNILKEQLSVVEPYEPPNLFETLKIMASNKRKSIRFADSRPTRFHNDDSVCVFKRTKLWKGARNYSMTNV